MSTQDKKKNPSVGLQQEGQHEKKSNMNMPEQQKDFKTGKDKDFQNVQTDKNQDFQNVQTDKKDFQSGQPIQSGQPGQPGQQGQSYQHETDKQNVQFQGQHHEHEQQQKQKGCEGQVDDCLKDLKSIKDINQLRSKIACCLEKLIGSEDQLRIFCQRLQKSKSEKSDKQKDIPSGQSSTDKSKDFPTGQSSTDKSKDFHTDKQKEQQWKQPMGQNECCDDVEKCLKDLNTIQDCREFKCRLACCVERFIGKEDQLRIIIQRLQQSGGSSKK